MAMITFAFVYSVVLLFKDWHTFYHSIAVAVRFWKISQLYKSWDYKERRGFVLAALFHDIGKIAIPVSILCSAKRLDRSDFEIMKSHTNIGKEILKLISDASDTSIPESWSSQRLIKILVFWGRLLKIDIPDEVYEAVELHHAGLAVENTRAVYPIRETALPAWIQLLHVVDTISACRDPRPYRQPEAVASVVKKILAEATVAEEVKRLVCQAYHFTYGENPKESLS